MGKRCAAHYPDLPWLAKRKVLAGRKKENEKH